ncbi:MAG: hypothetical protein FWE40_01375 [Oscillospiraceae bacterium]|jgi:hypothetical protein|nr:hypothetical protein [Oscillospiraceae bacterium]
MKKANWFLRIAVLLLVLTVPSFAFLHSTMARYTTRATVEFEARVAAFEVRSTPVNFGTNRMVYFHRRTRSHLSRPINFYNLHVDFEPYTSQSFRVDVTNTSQVSVRMRLEFFNLLHDNATPGANTRVPHLPAGQPWNNRPANDHLEVRIVNVRSYPPRTAAQGNYGGAGHHADGVYVAAGGTVRFYWDLQVYTYRHTIADKYGNDHVNARGWLNGAFRITYNIIAVQVDFV